MWLDPSRAAHPIAVSARGTLPASIFERIHAGESIDTKRRVVLALVLNQILSAGTHLIAKATLNAIGPLSTALLRFSAASITLILFELLRPRRQRVAREDIPKLLWLGFLVIPVNQGFFLFGLTESTASHAALLYALTPLVVFLLARRFLHEGNTREKLIGIVAAFAGVALILLDRGLAHEMSVMRGDLLLLVAVWAWALYTIGSKDLLKRYDPMTLTTWVLVTGTAMSLPAALIPGAIPPLRTLPLPVWGGIAYLAIGTSVIAYPLWLFALRRLEASKVAITTNAQPLLTSVLSWLLFQERFGPAFFLGAALILFGVTWVETRKGGIFPWRERTGAR
jgi:drug/metabolite transporter (DMT)-like permease